MLLESRGDPTKTVHLFDTWSGFPADKIDSAKESYLPGRTSAAIGSVKAFLGSYENCEFHQGTFPETANSILNKKSCFVHVDCDLYQSNKDCCEFPYPRMVKGGVMVFDDYGMFAHAGAKQAVDEFLLISPKSQSFCQAPTASFLSFRVPRSEF